MQNYFRAILLKTWIILAAWSFVIVIEQLIEMYWNIPDEVGYWSSILIFIGIINSGLTLLISMMMEFILNIEILNAKRAFVFYVIVWAISITTMYYESSLNLNVVWMSLFIELCMPLILGYIWIKLIQISKQSQRR